MHFTHYQITAGKVFAVNPHDRHFKIKDQNVTADQWITFNNWQSTQPPITADPSIKDGVYAKELLEIVWQYRYWKY